MFPLGDIRITAAANELLHDAEVNPVLLLSRHERGEWGEMSDEDRAANGRALTDGGRLVSRYKVMRPALHVYVITEADRSATTILLPSEY